jgi:hypothetical protein
MSLAPPDCGREVAYAAFKEFNPSGTDEQFELEWSAMKCKLPIPEGFKDAQLLRQLHIDQEQQKLRGEGASPELAPPLSPTTINEARKRRRKEDSDARLADIKSRFDATEFKLDTFMYELRGFTPANRDERVRLLSLCFEAIQTFTKAVAEIAQNLEIDEESNDDN